MLEDVGGLGGKLDPLHAILVRMNLEGEHEYKGEYDVLFEALYRLLPEGEKADIVNGKIIVYNSPVMPVPSHMVHFIIVSMRQWIHEQDVGGEVHGDRLLVAIPPPLGEKKPTGREPDIMYVPGDQLHLLEGAKFTGIPSLTIEVLGHLGKNRDVDLVDKVPEYARLGVQEYWIIDPEDRETRFGTLDGPTYKWHQWPPDSPQRVESTVVPGFYLERGWFLSPDGRNITRLYTVTQEKHLHERDVALQERDEALQTLKEKEKQVNKLLDELEFLRKS